MNQYKKLIVLILVCLSYLSSAQTTPQLFKYQSAIRDNNGLLLANKLVALKISLLKYNASGVVEYAETHHAASSDFGIVSINIGEGSPSIGNFASINWGNGPYFIKVDLDINNGSNFLYMGTTQLLSVPYALYAAKSGNAESDKDQDSLNEIQALTLINNSLQLNKNGGTVDLSKYTIDNNTDSQTISLIGNNLSITRGNSIKLNDIDSLNEIQNITLTNNNLQLSKNGGSIDLSKFDKDSQQLVLNGNNLAISRGNSIKLNDIDSVNEIQNLSLTNNNLQLSKNGGSIDLSKFDKDSQNLVLTGNTLSITRGNSIVLSGVLDLDGDPTNELQNLSIVGDSIKISKGIGLKLPKDNDLDSSNEIQTLSFTGDSLRISKSNSVLIPKNLDNDSTNELQNLTYKNDTIILSKSNLIVLPKDNDRDTLNEIQILSINRNILSLSKGSQVNIDADTLNEIQNLSFVNDSIKISKANSVYLPNMPAGSIIAFGGRNIPNGWLLCDGSVVSRVYYSRLFSTIDSIWGAGNSISTFHLPDLRGQFLRGVTALSNVDPDATTRTALNTNGNTGNNIGSYQDDNFKSHNHQLYNYGNSNYTTDTGAGGGFSASISTTLNRGGSETRPKNAYVYYIIKY